MDDDLGRSLSDAARTVWAKSTFDRDAEPGASPRWMPLWRHLDDAAAVAGKLWDDWLPRSVRHLVAGSFEGDEQRARRFVVWLAAVHDCGKASPAFAVQVPALAESMTRAGLAVRGPYANRRDLRHELAGHVCLVRWLSRRHGWDPDDGHALGAVVSGHHGVAPTSQQVYDAPFRTALLGEGRWTEVQDEFLDRQARFLDADDLRGPLQPSQPAQVLMTAVVIVADWIASNSELFPYEQHTGTASRVQRAWSRLDLPAPWVALDDEQDADALAAERFRFTGRARPVQSAAVHAARTVDEPGLIVIEAPMGEGKTEAALLAVEVLAARTGAGGCFLALPTQATTNAMFGRVTSWLDAIPGTAPHSIFLAHGKAQLNDEYRRLTRFGQVVSVAIDEDESHTPPRRGQRTSGTGYAPHVALATVVHEWLQGRKKGVLASFVVGTVDQVLFTALKSRHLMLRHLALAGKVVLIDEVHAYDTYMSTYLDRALHWLGAYGTPVVLLSATLPSRRREEMLKAYRDGVASASGGSAAPLEAVTGDDYPALTATSGAHAPALRLPTAASGRSSAVRVERLDDDLDALADEIGAVIAAGGCALVVRNTVRRVQETGQFLVDRFGAEPVTVTHARYLACDRAANDADLVRRFGPDGSMRPTGHVVVGSQVVEQSLDVDFDLLVTDLAPIDLVLQRMGRLHRHDRGAVRPETLRTPRCLIAGVDWTATPPQAVRGSRLVYEQEALLRALAVLGPHLDGKGQVRLPEDIAPLVQAAYAEEVIGPAAWQPALHEARAQAQRRSSESRRRAATFRLAEVERAGGPVLDWVQAGVGDVDEGPGGEAAVRDGAMTLEVLVVVRAEDGYLIPPWVTHPVRQLLDTQMEIRGEQARLLATCSLRLPPELCAPDRIDQTIDELEAGCWESAWQKHPLLAGQLVLVLDGYGRADLAGRELHYTPDFGLEVARRA